MSWRHTCVKTIFLLSISTLLCFAGEVSSLNHTLKQGETLESHQAIYSSNSAYTVSFFSSVDTNKKSYLGIFHVQDWVWVANRNTPILDGSGILTIDENGTFMITHSAGTIVLYSDDGVSDGGTRVATLHDNGNLVFSELNYDGSTKKILWQSFHYPTDCLLPGMVLGMVGDERAPMVSLSSCLASNQPSSGYFSLDWDPMEQQMVVKRRGIIVWTSGVLKDGIFEHIPRKLMQGLKPVVSKDGNSLSFSANNTAYLKLTVEGALTFGIDDKTTGKVYSLTIRIMNKCNGYTNISGCVKWFQPKCRGHTQTFILKQGVFRRVDNDEINGGFHYTNASAGTRDCRGICWEDCDCVAFVEADATGCIFWKGKSQLKFNENSHANYLYVISSYQSPIQTLQPPEPSTYKGRRIWIWISTTLLTLLVCLAIMIVMCWWRWKRRAQVNGDAIEVKTISVDTNELENHLRVFNFQCLSEVTNKFSLENKLGQGGFGPVFKGTLPEGNEIAVKRLSRSSGQGLEELKNELKLIAKLQHVNLVHLLGFCVEGEEKMLVYEYMPNKSLDSILFDPLKSCILECTTRLKIIEGIAQGLLYLHEHTRLTIVHRDLKASNILLDAFFNPKISDFGMARIFKRNEVTVNTERIVGTYGYMSPEYAMEGIFSVKSDVFSFGILILEIVSGRRNISFNDFGRHINLIGYAWELWQEEAWIELVDSTMKDSLSMSQLHRTIHVGLLCVEESPSNRPAVSEVISMLTNKNILLPSIKKPAFLMWSPPMKQECHSINGLSLSTVTAR